MIPEVTRNLKSLVARVTPKSPSRVLSTSSIYSEARARAAACLVVSTFKSRPFGHKRAPRASRQLSAFALLLVGLWSVVAEPKQMANV